MTKEELREAVARVVDPAAFRYEPQTPSQFEQRARARKTADDVMGLTALGRDDNSVAERIALETIIKRVGQREITADDAIARLGEILSRGAK